MPQSKKGWQISCSIAVRTFHCGNTRRNLLGTRPYYRIEWHATVFDLYVSLFAQKSSFAEICRINEPWTQTPNKYVPGRHSRHVHVRSAAVTTTRDAIWYIYLKSITGRNGPNGNHREPNRAKTRFDGDESGGTSTSNIGDRFFRSNVVDFFLSESDFTTCLRPSKGRNIYRPLFFARSASSSQSGLQIRHEMPWFPAPFPAIPDERPLFTPTTSVVFVTLEYISSKHEYETGTDWLGRRVSDRRLVGSLTFGRLNIVGSIYT